MLSESPWVVTFDNFLTDAEINAIIRYCVRPVLLCVSSVRWYRPSVVLCGITLDCKGLP